MSFSAKMLPDLYFFGLSFCPKQLFLAKRLFTRKKNSYIHAQNFHSSVREESLMSITGVVTASSNK